MRHEMQELFNVLPQFYSKLQNNSLWLPPELTQIFQLGEKLFKVLTKATIMALKVLIHTRFRPGGQNDQGVLIPAYRNIVSEKRLLYCVQ